MCTAAVLTESPAGELTHGALQPVRSDGLHHQHALERRRPLLDQRRQLLLTLAAAREVRPHVRVLHVQLLIQVGEVSLQHDMVQIFN